MKHFLILLAVALVTLSIVFIIYRPDLVEDVWLWVIGLAGTVIGLAKEGYKSVQNFIQARWPKK